MGPIATAYGAATLSVFGLAGFARFRHKDANAVLIAAATLEVGWLWTIITQAFTSFHQPTLSFAIVDAMSLCVVLYLTIRYGICLWTTALGLTFVCQMLIHVTMAPGLGVRSDSWTYMYWLNGFFLLQLTIVALKAALVLTQRGDPTNELLSFYKDVDPPPRRSIRRR